MCLLCDFQNNNDEESKNHYQHFHWSTKTIIFLRNYLPPMQKIDTQGAAIIVKFIFKVVDKKNHGFVNTSQKVGEANNHLPMNVLQKK